MLPDTPSTQLRNALRSGAEIGLARAIANKGKPAGVGQFIEKRLADLSVLDKGYIRKLADAMLKSAELMYQKPSDEIPTPDDIPTNGDAFGDDWEGKRVKWFGEWQIPGEDEWYKFSGTMPDISSLDEIAAYAAELAHSYIEAYPTRFIHNLPAYQGEVKVRIIGREKAF